MVQEPPCSKCMFCVGSSLNTNVYITCEQVISSKSTKTVVQILASLHFVHMKFRPMHTPLHTKKNHDKRKHWTCKMAIINYVMQIINPLGKDINV